MTCVGFPAHGAWRQVEKAIVAGDVLVGESWEFRDHWTMAEIIAAKALVLRSNQMIQPIEAEPKQVAVSIRVVVNHLFEPEH